MSSRYRHTQTGWVIIASALVIVLLASDGLLGAGFASGWLFVGAIVVVLVAGFGVMTITVDDHCIEARLGVGIIRKRVRFAEVRSYRRVNNPWYYGWGIRFFPGGTLYNVSGLSAVELILASGRKLRLGSDEPEALLKAIEAAKGRPEPLTPPEEQSLSSRALRYVFVSGGIGLLIVAASLAIVALESRAPRIEILGDKFAVCSTIYGAEVPLRNITSVTLEHRLPRIRLRTNGFALGGMLRGHFRVDELGDGQLFIEAGKPPYVIVRTPGDYVVVNFVDSSRTNELYAKLKEATRRPSL